MGFFATKYGAATPPDTASQPPPQSKVGQGFFAKRYGMGTDAPPVPVETPKKKPGFFSKVVNVLSRAGETAGKFVAPIFGSKAVQDTLKPGVEAVQTNWKQGTDSVAEAIFSIQKREPLESKTTKVANAANGIVNILLSPVGALMASGQQVPGLKYPLKGAEVASESLTNAVRKVYTKMVRTSAAWGHLDRPTEEQIEPFAQIANLVAQTAAAKGITDLPSLTSRAANAPLEYLNAVRTRSAIASQEGTAAIPRAKSFTPEVPQRVIEPLPPARSLTRLGQKNTKIDNLPVGTELFHKDLGRFTVTEHKFVPVERGMAPGVTLRDAIGMEADFALRELHGLRKVNKDLRLPPSKTVPDKVVQIAHQDGTTSIMRIPEKDFGIVQERVDGTASGIAGKKQPNGDVWHITAKPPETLLSREGFKDAGVVAVEDIPRSRVSTPTGSPDVAMDLAALRGTGETATRGLSAGVEAKAIENKLTQGFGELPEFQRLSMAEQAKKAADILESDYARAKDIAMGKELPPADLLPESVFVAVENRAIKQGDVATLRDLATQSSLTTQATTMGQRIRTLAERDPESATGAISDILKVREVAAERRMRRPPKEAQKSVVGEIKTSMEKSVASKQTWESFIKDLEC